jgi:hypothetical protein
VPWREKKPRFWLIVIVICVVLGGLVWGTRKILTGRLHACQIQGNGSISPYLGREVVLTGIVGWVSGDHDPGFILIDENCPEKMEGSRGVFISLAEQGELVDPGDRVRLKGLVGEKEGETRLVVDPSRVEVLSLGQALPAPANLQQGYRMDPLSFNYENWEGMLVSLGRVRLLGEGLTEKGWLAVPRFNSDLPENIAEEVDRDFYLWIRGEGWHPPDQTSLSGCELADATGVLRQGSEGYLLELVAPAAFRLAPENDSVELPAKIVAWSEGGSTPGEETPWEGAQLTPGGRGTAWLTATPVSSPTWYPVPLLISEVLPNPEGKEPEGEWIEIYNPREYGIPLTGVKLGDEISPTGKEGLVRFPDGYYIEGGEVLVIAHSAEVFHLQYGFLPDFELSDSDTRVPDLLPYPAWGRSGVQLSNSGDEVLLVDPWDGIIDLLVYGKSPAGGFSPPVPAPKEGHTLERYPPEGDHDKASDWRERSGGSPGKLDRLPSTPSVSSTVAPSPTATPGLSQTLSPTPPPGFPASATTTSSPLPDPTGTIPGSIPESATWTLTHTLFPTVENTARPTPSPTQAADLTPTPSMLPEPTSQTSPTSTLPSDAAATQTPSATFPYSVTPGSGTACWTEDPGLTASPLPSRTTSLTATPDASSTPTSQLTITSLPEPSPTGEPLPTASLVINEIHADPDPVGGDADGSGGVSSDDDEFLEMVNLSAEALDLSGWVIQDALRDRFVFPEGTWLGEGCGVVVFGGEVPYSEIRGSLVFGAGSLGLNNSGDIITILDRTGQVVLEIQYGPEGGQDQSLARFPDLVGELPLVLHSEIPAAAGRLFSPGTRVDGTNFGPCP